MEHFNCFLIQIMILYLENGSGSAIHLCKLIAVVGFGSEISSIEVYINYNKKNNVRMKTELGEYVQIKTGKQDANASSENGRYPFFTCAVE